MQITEETFSHLQDLVLCAALDPTVWPKFLSALAYACNENRVHFITVRSSHLNSAKHLTHGYSEEALAAWDEHFSSINAWEAGFSTAKLGQVISSEAMCSEDVLLKTEFYNDWVRPQEDARIGGGALISKNNGDFVALGLNMRLKDGEVYRNEALTVIQRLVPLVQHASDVNRRILVDSITGATNAVRQMIISTDRQIHFSNDAAKRLIELDSYLKVDPSGRFRIDEPLADKRLSNNLTKLKLGKIEPDTFLVPSDPATATIVCDSTPHIPSGTFNNRLSGLSAQPLLVLTFRPRLMAGCSVAALVGATGLTQSEAEIVSLLASGKGTSEIASIRGTSENTVRNQIKSAQTRCGLHSRTMLVRLAVEILA